MDFFAAVIMTTQIIPVEFSVGLDTISAGLRRSASRSVNGNGTMTMSPAFKDSEVCKGGLVFLA